MIIFRIAKYIMRVRYAVSTSPEYKEWLSRFTRCIDKTLNDVDSWDGITFVHDEENPDITIRLSSSSEIMDERTNKEVETDIYGNPTELSVTFYTERPVKVLINANNYINGVPISKLGKKEYRKYVINHEVGHALGYGHLPCDESTRICPVMYQMTKGVPNGFEPSFSVTSRDYDAPRLY